LNTLYLIPTPLAENALHTIPIYTKNVIEKCDVFVVENLKTARRFIKAIFKEKNIDNCTFVELDKHQQYKFDEQFFYTIQQKNIGLMSEAGTPCIADPGNKVVQLAHELRWKIVPIVGPNSILLALMTSGFNGQQFSFNGYLPIETRDRKSKIIELERLAHKNNTQIFMDTPYRNQKTFEELKSYCQANTKLCIACNITANDEWIFTKTIAEWKKQKIDFAKKPCIFILGK
jgi:16S rRNA (cytidine1402-2'-O)-methyltransferase